MSPELEARILAGAAERVDRRAGIPGRPGRFRALGWLGVGLPLGLGLLGVLWGLVSEQATAQPAAGPGLGGLWQLGVPFCLAGLLVLVGWLVWRLAGWLESRAGDTWMHAAPRRRVPWRLVTFAGLVWLAWFGLHGLVIAFLGLADDVRPADLAVVLGNEVLPDGRPHPRLASRLDRALGLYRAGLVGRILVTGGRGKTGFEEADVMRDHLLAHGVPAEDLLVDRQGHTTFHSAVRARAILDNLGLRSVVLCSQYYHLPRARLAFARAGLGSVATAHAPMRPEWHEPWSLLREWVGYYVYLLRSYPGRR
jgi:uncharacterized SAM-binding protein YcdF (DUF218 family)